MFVLVMYARNKTEIILNTSLSYNIVIYEELLLWELIKGKSILSIICGLSFRR